MHAPYCPMQTVKLSKVLNRYILKDRIYEEKLLNIKLCFDFLHNNHLNNYSLQENCVEHEKVYNIVMWFWGHHNPAPLTI
jgi:hypothetical protein